MGEAIGPALPMWLDHTLGQFMRQYELGFSTSLKKLNGDFRIRDETLGGPSKDQLFWRNDFQVGTVRLILLAGAIGHLDYKFTAGSEGPP